MGRSDDPVGLELEDVATDGYPRDAQEVTEVADRAEPLLADDPDKSVATGSGARVPEGGRDGVWVRQRREQKSGSEPGLECAARGRI